jgi:DNA helicase-2/ATP-dependent DNA helicase PcrA
MGFSNVNVSTFHGLCAKLLAQEGKYYAQDKMIQDWQVEKAFNLGEDSKVDIGDIRSFISYQKNYLIPHTGTFVEKDSEYSEIELRNYFKLYENFKRQS